MNHDPCTTCAMWPPFERIFSNICEATERNGWMALVTDAESMAEAEEAAFGVLVVPRTDCFVLACHAIAKGGDVDQLCNLAKPASLECD